MGVTDGSQLEARRVQRVAQIRKRAERDVMKRIARGFAQRAAVAMVEAAAQKSDARSHSDDIRRRQNQRALRCEDAAQLAEIRKAILEVLDAFDRQDRIERGIGKWQSIVEVAVVIRGAEQNGAAGVDIDAVRVVSSLPQRR